MIYVSNDIKKPQRKKIKGVTCIESKYRNDIGVEGIARYALSGDRNPRSKMFHDELNMSECTSKDRSGICMGHEMSLKDFIVKYCGGIMPDSM